MASQHKIIKAKKRRADYEKKRNILRNNVKNSRYLVLTAGDGTLPKSRKYKKTNKKTTASVQ